MSTTSKTQSGVTKLSAFPAIVITTIPLNAPVLSYRFAVNDVQRGEQSGAVDGFIHYNQANGNVFYSLGGQWTFLGSVGNLDAFDPTLIDRWGSTLPTYAQPGATVGGNAIQNQSGYRIGTTDRTIGDTANMPDGAMVLNTTNNNCFVVSGGLWASGTFPASLYAAWLEHDLDYVETTEICIRGTARIG